MYQIIQAQEASTLSIKVEKELKLGWECQGGLVVHTARMSYADVDTYLQAMVKKDEKQVL